MKNIYYLLLLVIVTLVSSNAVADTPIKLRVDDSSRVVVKVNYRPVNISNGLNKLDVPKYGSVQIEAVDGCYLKEVSKPNKSEGGNIPMSISSMRNCNLYISDEDKNVTFTVKSGIFDEARTGSCIVKIDDASKVKMVRYESQTGVNLKNGDNDVKWIPGVEKTLVITNANYGDAPIYRVTLDGVEVESSSNQFFVTPKDGSVVNITANYPDVDYAVKFNFSDNAAKSVISKVMIDGLEVANYNEEGFKVKAGKKLTLTFDKVNYSLDGFKVNGESISLYGSYECIVRNEMNFEISAHKYATVKSTLNVDKAANVTVYQGQSYNNKVISVHDGENVLELNETNSMIQIKPNSGCKIDSVKVNGNLFSIGYDGACEIKLTEGMRVDVATSAIVRDQKATVFIDDISLANYGFNFYRADHSTVQMQSGENTLMFSKDDHHFMFGAYGTDMSKMVVKLNGTALAPTYPGGSSFEFDLKDNDRLEILLKGGTDGIDSVGHVKGNERKVYRIDGTRVTGENLPRGLYIIDGKKVLINK